MKTLLLPTITIALLQAYSHSIIFAISNTQQYCFNTNRDLMKTNKFVMRVLATFEDASNVDASIHVTLQENSQDQKIIDTIIGPAE